MVAAALGQAGTPEATHELAALMGDPLPVDTRRQIVAQLALAAAPDAETTGALTRAIDEPGGEQAALALGAEARTIGDEDAGDAIDELLKRFAAAGNREAARGYLIALGNTGSRRVLPALKATIGGTDYGLAEVATLGLRFIPGDDVDELLEGLIASASSVIVPAIHAAGYRSPDLWLDKLRGFEKQFAGHKQVTDALDAVIAHWTPMAQAAAPASQPD
jgi:HEAT repeat protein